ncbi:hypothetical protein QNI19_16500 [Cytophagaceae bacterium DM2B3-1]|uniref:Viral coat protein P2 N-terminal domain-containing protein n=2 Tax=Xanthocytophaga TaxID=3078918 RepID=A0ABT7CLH3_9BACT|nr:MULTISPECIES: hypothetical protein [Xanthocytophaga]MDJ1494547.1 hypothetical protein [Xanthocytophaga flavus]MDJ1505010.1 hypothetical protein [Xanthocytophaga agilis]
MFTNKQLSASTLQEIANQELSYFTGNTQETTMNNDVQAYLGDGDDLLHFGGSAIDSTKSFASAFPSGDGLRQFGIRLKNTHETLALTALLFAGYHEDITTNNLNRGVVKTGAFKSVENADGLTASAQLPGKTVEEFLEWLKYVPSQLVMMKLRTDNIEQIGKPISIKTLSPFQDLPTDYIQPENAQDQYSNNEKVVTFMVEKQLDFSRRFEYSVEPGTTVTIVYYIGATLDTAVALERKRAKAKVTMNFIGSDGINQLGQLQAARQLGM